MVDMFEKEQNCPTLNEDWSLYFGDSVESICYHGTLNAFIITTRDNKIKVFDSSSNSKLCEVSDNKKGMVYIDELS